MPKCKHCNQQFPNKIKLENGRWKYLHKRSYCLDCGKTWGRCKYTDDQVKNAVKSSFSYAAALKKLSLSPKGGNYRTIKSKIKQLGIDVSHFKGQGWNLNGLSTTTRPLQDYLSNKFPIKSHRLRLRLIREGILTHQCQSCSRKTWLGKSIPLSLHHKDGNHFNNSLDNLELLCPNCHRQTENFGIKNRGQYE